MSVTNLMSRRRLPALLSVVLLLSGCAATTAGDDAADVLPSARARPTDRPTQPDQSPRSRQPTQPTPTSSADEPQTGPQEDEPPPDPPAYEPDEGEVYPNAKRLAARVAQTLTTYDVGTTAEDLVDGLTTDPERIADTARAAATLLHAGSWSRGTVVYPELGGVGPEAVAVMVLVRQQVGTSTGATDTITRTLDVRLRLDDDEWAFDRLVSIGGSPPDAPSVSRVGRAIVADERITLPDSARWDIERGDIDPALLRLMRDLAERAPYEVLVLSSGHPFEVFDTDRQSDHTRGRAVDIHVIDGQRVIDARQEGSRVHELVQWLYERPDVSAIGSPWALDGYGGRSFSDVVHADHIHVAVRPSDDSS